MSIIDKIKLNGTTYDVGKIPDTTLTQPGQAADSAKVGAEFNKVKADLDAQVSDINVNFDFFGCYDLLRQFANYQDSTREGVTFNWNTNKTECTVTGTAISTTAFNALYSSTNTLPPQLKAGETYIFRVHTTDPIRLRFYIYQYHSDSSLNGYTFITEDTVITLPSTLIGLGLRIQVISNTTVSNAKISVFITKTKSNTELTSALNMLPQPKGILSSDVALNDVTEAGVWLINSTTDYTDSPLPHGKTGTLEVFMDGLCVVQRITRYDGECVYYRTSNTRGSFVDRAWSELNNGDKITEDSKKARDEISALNACLYAADGYSSGLIDMMLSVDGKWTDPGTSNHIMIPVRGGDTVSITRNHTHSALFGVLTDYDSPINGVKVKFSAATGYTGRIPVETNSPQVFVLPDDARYIAINASISGNNYLPLSVKINGTERLNGIDEYIKEIDGTIDVLQKYGDHISRVVNGITFAWSDDKKSCAVSGESSDKALVNLYYNETAMPAWLRAGEKYRMMIKRTQPGVTLHMKFYAGAEETLLVISDNTEITIPSNATGCYIRLVVASGHTLDSVITIGMSLELPNGDLSNLYFDNLNKSDYVLSCCKTKTETINGITYDWYGVTQRKCRITGEATEFSIYTLYDDRLPVGMNIGDPFIVNFDTWPVIGLSFNAIVRFYDKDDNELLLVRGTNNRIDIPFTVPYNAYRWKFDIYVKAGTTINVTLETLRVVKLKQKLTSPRRFFSIVDDDASTDVFVTRFHDACMHNGICGNYAVLTDRLDLGVTSPDKLLSYEDEGFGMLIHASDQSMARTPEWAITNRTAAETQACRANLAKGLRKMQEYGFIDYKHWITPGGHFEKDLKAIARSFGLEGLYSIGNGRHNTMQDVDKYCIKRVSFHPTDDTQDGSIAGMKDFIDKTVNDTAGWLIITTHFNEWGGLTWDDTLDANGYPIGYARFNEVVQYALNAGLTPMSVPQAWTYYKPILDANLKECNELL